MVGLPGPTNICHLAYRDDQHRGVLEKLRPIGQIGRRNQLRGGNMNVRTGLSRVTRATMVIFVVALCLPAALTAGAGYAAESTKSTVKPPPGALKPVPATGIGTPAAMDDPRCNV